jgi:hypothetical protein
MALFRDRDEERNARVEHIVESVQRAQAKAVQQIEDGKRAAEEAADTIKRIKRALQRKLKSKSR